MSEWREVPGYPTYSVSDEGIVKSNYRNGRILKFGTSRGYPQVKLYNNGFSKSIKVHKVVSLAFMIRPSKEAHIDHKDGNKYNNKLSNLEWVTHGENIRRAEKMGLINHPKGCNSWNTKFSDIDIIVIREACTMFSQRRVAKYLGVCQGTISHIVRRRNWKHI